MYKPNKRIFLCHVKEDRKFVLNLFQRLKDLELEPWMDEKDLSVGDEWNPKIKEVIENAKIAVVCFSKKSVDKIGYFQTEIKMILQHLEKHPPNSNYFMPILIKNLKKLPVYINGTVNSSNYHAKFIRNDEDLNILIDIIYNICASDNTSRIMGIKGKTESNLELKREVEKSYAIEDGELVEYLTITTKIGETPFYVDFFRKGKHINTLNFK